MASDSPKCIDGKGCSAVIEMSQQFETFMATAKQSMEDHAEKSDKFWEDQKEQANGFLLQISECVQNTNDAAIKFNDGHHRMNGIEKDVNALGGKQRVHEKGEYGAHSTIKKQFGNVRKTLIGVIGGLALIFLFVAIKHPDILELVLKKV